MIYMKKRVLALFTCFNRREKTERCVNSLRNSNFDIDIDFLVCDDNSTDGTTEALKKYERVKILGGTGSLFYTGGMRMIIAEAQQNYRDYDYYLLMNDDVLFDTHAIDDIVRQAENKNNAVIVGCTYGRNHELTYGGIIFDNPSKKVRYTKFGPGNDALRCDTFHANCVLIPRKVFFDAENMDEVYNHSLGDLDYGLKISRMGYDILVSEKYIGSCIIDSPQNTWVDKQLSRIERIRKKESKKGVPTNEWFHFVRKNFGLKMAIIYSITPYIKILFRK